VRRSTVYDRRRQAATTTPPAKRVSGGNSKPPQWLDVDWVLAQLAQTGSAVVERFRPFVEAGRDQPAP